MRRFMKAKLDKQEEELFRAFDDNDPALEWCENRLLETSLPGRSLQGEALARDYELFADLTAEDTARAVAAAR